MRKVKQTLPYLLAMFALALAGICGWYLYVTSNANADAARLEDWKNNLKHVRVEFVVTPPPETPKDQFLYVRGSETSLGAWDGAGVQLMRSDDGKYRGSVE